MSKTARILTGVVLVAHVWFFVLESILWTSKFAQLALHMSAEEAVANKILAMNQGAYNAVLAAGLGWALRSPASEQKERASFFLVAIIALGLVGAVTASRPEILLLQSAPAVAALVALRRSPG